MVTKYFFSLPVAALCACAFSGTAFGAPSNPAAVPSLSPSIAIFYSFDATPAPETFSRMTNELTRILKPTGLSLAWRPISGNRGNENYPEVLVFRFRGTCDLSSLPSQLLEFGNTARGLAETQRSNGRMLPFGDVQCDRLRQYLAPVASAARPAARNEIFGRAMARVVAHEMLHMLTGSAEHGKHGIARAAHSRDDLACQIFDFSSSDAEWLRAWNRKSTVVGETPSISSEAGAVSSEAGDEGLR